MNMFRSLFALALLLPFGLAYSAPQGFSDLTCDSDIEKAMSGRTLPNGAVAAIEASHKDIGLKDLGGYEVADGIFLGAWRICGNQYMFLEHGSRVKAVLKIPDQFKSFDEVFICSPVGGSPKGTIVAVPTTTQSKTTIRPQLAWRVDEKKVTFVPITTGPLECQREPGM
jgi:hypothetical protein